LQGLGRNVGDLASSTYLHESLRVFDWGPNPFDGANRDIRGLGMTLMSACAA
jgi:hypothetical protein